MNSSIELYWSKVKHRSDQSILTNCISVPCKQCLLNQRIELDCYRILIDRIFSTKCLNNSRICIRDYNSIIHERHDRSNSLSFLYKFIHLIKKSIIRSSYNCISQFLTRMIILIHELNLCNSIQVFHRSCKRYKSNQVTIIISINRTKKTNNTISGILIGLSSKSRHLIQIIMRNDSLKFHSERLFILRHLRTEWESISS